MIPIRHARLDDIVELKILIPIAVRTLSQGYYTSRQIETAVRHMFGVDSLLIQDGTYFVAESQGRIVGCGGWSRRRTLFGGDQWKPVEDDSLDPATDAGRIRAFFVHPGWARQGIGRRLLQTCEQAARREGFSRLELVATLPGEPLYAALGYTATERIEISLPDGETLPAVQMGKNL